MTHYYDEKQTSKFDPFLIKIKLPDISLELYSAHGIFSKKYLDNGTKTLIKYMNITDNNLNNYKNNNLNNYKNDVVNNKNSIINNKNNLTTDFKTNNTNKSVLDLGCGYGIIGIIAKIRYPSIKLTQSDINERAIKLSLMNAKKYNLDINIIKSFLFDNIKESFDVILVNPPYVAGRELIFKMIKEAKEHIKKGGSLQLVARHNKGGKVLSQKMEELFGNIKVLGKQSGFRVYSSKKM